jgi:hypothetical protein
MKIKQTAICFFLTAISAMLLVSVAQAATPVTLALNNTTGDAMQITITGDAEKSIQLSFLPPGATAVTTISFGMTNSSGNFTTTISSGGYGIPSGSPAYATVNGAQSSTLLWPSYTSSLTLTQTSVQIAVGQAVTVNGSNSLILVSNSGSSSFSASISGSQITITGVAAGSGTINLCSSGAGCAIITVTAGGQGQTQVSLSQNVVVLRSGQTQEIYILGGPSGSGYLVSSNSNPASVTSNISGQSNVLTLYGNTTAGTSVVSVCSRAAEANCASVNITNLNTSATVLSFSQSSLSLIPNQSQSVTVSGGTDNNYYLSANSNSGVASVTISGNTVLVVGGNNSGSTVISVCSTTVNASCGNLYVTTNAASSSASATTLAFSQNVVSVTAGKTSNVTVSGGDGTGYIISANSNPTIVTASISGSSNVITLLGGSTVGSAIITVCSASSSGICASLYVTVKEATQPFSFSQNNISLIPGQTVSTAIVGGSDTNYTISTNSNPSAVSASSMSNGKVITLTGGTIAGNATITICSVADTNNCSALYATLSASAVASAPFSFDQNNIVLASGQTINVAIVGGTDASYLVFTNSSSRTVAASPASDGKTIVLTGGTISGTAIITVCSAANANNCSTLYATLNSSAAASTATPTPAAAVLGTTTFHFTSLLTLGSTGQEVRALQQLLKDLGYYTYSTITGYFGPVTKKAVIVFQKAYNLKPYPGWVGPSTREKLNTFVK